jgi:hypothetical protein
MYQINNLDYVTPNNNKFSTIIIFLIPNFFN